MEDIPMEKRFHFNDGSSAKNLKELKEKIETIPYDEFYRYVTPEENHLANWIDHVLRQHELARKVKAAGNIVETVEILNEELGPSLLGAVARELRQLRQRVMVLRVPRVAGCCIEFGDLRQAFGVHGLPIAVRRNVDFAGCRWRVARCPDGFRCPPKR